MLLSKLLSGIEHYSENIDDKVIDNIAYKECNIKGNCLFVLVKRVNEGVARIDLEGHEVTAIICEEDAVICNSDAPRITVKDSRRALAYLFYNYYDIGSGDLKIIGVTGTNGKSTTALLIKQILETNGSRVGFIGTGVISIQDKIISDNDYSMTTPDPDKLYGVLRAMIDTKCEYAVMEVSSHSLKLGKVSPINFSRAVFTNLSPEHLDFHKDMYDYYSTKASLLNKCKMAIINVDDPYGKRLYSECLCEKTGVGVIEAGDIYATDLEMSGLEGSKYLYHGKGFISAVDIRLPGCFNVYNSLLAMCCAISLGVKPTVAKTALGSINEINGRLNIINGEITVIIDYAHTSKATEECLHFLSGIKGKGTLTAVFGCGGNRDRSKRPDMARSVGKYADKIIVTQDNSRDENIDTIIADIISGFDKDSVYEIIKDRKSAITKAVLEAHKGDYVVILGKGPEKYNLDASGYHPFDEKEIVASALKAKEV